MDYTTTQHQPRGRSRRRTTAASPVTLASFKEKPDSLFGYQHLEEAGLCGSRASNRRAINAGKFPAPMRLPSGHMAWRGRVIADWLDGLERAAGERRAATNRTCELQVTA